MQLEINTNKAETSGPLVELPPHLAKIMQARSTTNKTSSMARNAILLPQNNNITTPVNARMSSTHRIGTSNGDTKGSSLNQTYQNIPKNNNLFQTEDLPNQKGAQQETTDILGHYTNNNHG
jgi:hypothetical protein